MLSLRALLVPCLLPAFAAAQLPVLDDCARDASVPALAEVVGHGFGERITSPEEMLSYANALAAASPRAELFRYGVSLEGRPLVFLMISSPENIARLPDVKSGMQRLADPRGADDATLDRLCRELPAITWLAYSVHGNEISSTDAGLLLAWHLCSAKNDRLADTILHESVVVIDPLQNPDGRARFVFHARQTRGRWPDASPDAAERDEPWPGGRTNHALFDMNRDWFACTQPETRARVRAFLDWRPVAFVDLHEMGANSTYFFGPPASPRNPELPEAGLVWQERYGRNNAEWFDREGFDYFTREEYDSFYPGYGDSWPGLQGAVSATYEEGSVRGLVVELRDETTKTYLQSVLHHFIASLSTAETTAENREAALRRFLDYRRSAVADGSNGGTREFVLEPSRDPWRAARLARLLAFQGIEVARLTEAARNASVRPHGGRDVAEHEFPAGSYVVRLDQPSKRLAASLLAKQQDMDSEFVAEQRRRHERREPLDIYDVTGWSLPLLFGVDCFETDAFTEGPRERVVAEDLDEPVIDPSRFADGDTPRVAWVLPGGSNATMVALARLLREGCRVHCAGKPFRIGERRFPAGSLIVKTRENDASVHPLVRALRAALGVDAFAADSSWVDEGVSFGSNRVALVKPPKVVLAWDEPTSSYSAGAARYVLEQRYGVPVTEIRTERLGHADLEKVDVIVLPDGGDYGEALGKRGTERLKNWIRDGGTLVTLGGGATRWLTRDDVGLLASSVEKRDKPKPAEPESEKAGEPEQDVPAAEKPAAAAPQGETPPATVSKPYDYERAIQPEEESPARTPGALLRVTLDPEQWLAFGLGPFVDVVGQDRDIYTPITLDQGQNVGVYAPRAELLQSGFAWDDKLDQLARKAYLVHESHGRGHVVAFAEDPTVRGFVEGTDLLLLNAVLLGPAF